ncbi:hypothetical protein K8S19_03390 [bacterium]|nr:hypothetical protein [bacterium]
MRKLDIKTGFIILSVAFLLPLVAAASWESLAVELNIDNNENANHPAIAVPRGDIVAAGRTFAAFQETTGGNQLIYVKRWNGADWWNMAGHVNFQNDEDAYAPDLAIDPHTDVPYICWFETSTATTKVRLSKWNGADWQGNTICNRSYDNNAGNAKIVFNHQIPAWGQMTWLEDEGGLQRVYALRFNGTDLSHINMDESSNGYLNVQTTTSAFAPSITVGEDNLPVIAWQEDTANMDVYVRKYSGVDWILVGGRVGTLTTTDGAPSVAVNSNNQIFVAYVEDSLQPKILVKYWNESDWVLHGSVVASNNNVRYPKLVVDETDTLFLSYGQELASMGNIYVKFYNGSDWESLDDSLNINVGKNAMFADIAVSESGPFVTWHEEDNGSGNDWVHVKHWIEPTPVATPTPIATATPEGTLTPAPDHITGADSTKAYPLPASTQVNFVYRMTDAEGEPVVRVYNTHFRRVAEITGSTTLTGEGTINWDCSLIAPGVYFYQITIGEKETAMEKFIIAR